MTSILTKFCALFALCLTAIAAQAEQFGPMVASDLNGDGVMERFVLIDKEEDYRVDLVITDPRGGVTVARDIAWRGGIGQEPMLDLAPNGSVRVVSMNESIGRDRWWLTLTIAHRDGAYKVAGFTFDWYDTLDPEAYGVCDLNLLSGKGLLTKGDTPERQIRASLLAREVTEWKDDVQVPPECERGE